MKKINILLCVLFLINNSLKLKSQVNLIPNPGFQDGPEENPLCLYTGDNSSTADEFDEDIYYWKSARAYYMWPHATHVPSVDWVDLNSITDSYGNLLGCFKPGKIPSPNLSTRFIHMKGDPDMGSGYKEGVRVGFTQTLQKGKKYTLRLKVACIAMPGEIQMHLSVWGPGWDANANPNLQKNVFVFNDFPPPEFTPPPQPWIYKWITISKEIVPDSDDLKFLIILSKNGYIFIDDVELFPFCPDEMLIENRVYHIDEKPFEAKVIKAGYDVGAPTANGNVIVESGANVTYKAEQLIVLTRGFHAKPGPDGRFHAYLAPCGLNCFPAVANAGDYTTVCDENPIQIGSPPKCGFTYSWSANPPSAINYLSNTNISDPLFYPPTSGYGTFIYTLTVTDQCGDQASNDVVVNYTTEIDIDAYLYHTDTYVYVESTGLYFAKIEFTDMSPQMEKIIIRIFECDQTTIHNAYTLIVGQDFNVNDCPFFFITPDPVPVCDGYIYGEIEYFTLCCNAKSGNSEHFIVMYNSKDEREIQENNYLVENNKVKSSEFSKNNLDYKYKNSELIIYPNPNNGKFFLAYTGDLKSFVSLEISDIIGNTIYRTEKLNGKYTLIDIREHSKGTYIIKLQSKENIINKKLIVE